MQLIFVGESPFRIQANQLAILTVSFTQNHKLINIHILNISEQLVSLPESLILWSLIFKWNLTQNSKIFISWNTFEHAVFIMADIFTCSSCQINFQFEAWKHSIHITENIFKCIFFKENVWISIKIQLNFYSIANKSALFQVMPGNEYHWAWLGHNELKLIYEILSKWVLLKSQQDIS